MKPCVDELSDLVCTCSSKGLYRVYHDSHIRNQICTSSDHDCATHYKSTFHSVLMEPVNNSPQRPWPWQPKNATE